MKIPSILGLVLVCLPMAVAPIYAAESSPARTVPPGRGNSDVEEWQSLKAMGRRKPPSIPPAASPAAVAQKRQEYVSALLGDADHLREFRTKHPAHPNVNEAKRLEALSLVQAWAAGDSTQNARRQQLVSEVRKDSSLPEATRSAVAAYADHLAVGKRADLSKAEKLIQYENVNRALIREFPSVPDGHEALLQIAKDSGDARAVAIARDVAAAAEAPEWIRREAAALVQRHELLGKSLPELARPVLGAGNPTERAQRKPVIVYSWATPARGSIALARRIAAEVPPGVAVIGLNLDARDLAPARKLAEAEKLPGDQIYDWMGRRGEFAQQIHLLDPGVVYLVGRDGVIRSVSAQRDLAAALAQIVNL